MLKDYEFASKELKEIWEGMYSGNEYLFPYASRQFNEINVRYLRIKPSAYACKKKFYVYFNAAGQPRVIMPLTVKGHAMNIIGYTVGGVGALDFIYPKDVENGDFHAALHELASVSPPPFQLELHEINERSRLYRFFEEEGDVLRKEYSVRKTLYKKCAKIIIPGTYGEYYGALGKNAKANLKKFYNRLNKNNIPFELRVIKGPLKDGRTLAWISDIYCKRKAERDNRIFVLPLKIKTRYFKAMTWAMEEMAEQFTFSIYIKGAPAAFMSGFMTNFNEIVFPYVAFDSSFAAYSPGKLMLSESVKWCQEHPEEKIKALDLSRGQERYKFEMGGIAHNNYAFYIRRG